MDRVRKGYKASLCSVGIWGIFITIMFVFQPKAIAEIFFHEPKAIMIAIGYLTIIGVSEAFMAVELMTVGALSGLGKTHLCSVISILFTSARIPLAIILGGALLFCDINCKRNYLCMYILLDHERQRYGKNDETQ